MTQTHALRIDVFHDTACPWCRIGKAHLRSALTAWDGPPADVHFHPFFLNADIPPEGHDFATYMNAKGQGQIPLDGWFEAPRRMGEAAGLDFHFERILYAPNTTLSHQLIALAPDDQREAIIDAVYAAYFEHGQNIGDAKVLVSLAQQQGLDAEATRAALADDNLRQSVLAEATQATQLGITGVPFFVINNSLAFSGAQAPQTILQIMQQATEEKTL